jgi:hypothetical protein
MKIQRRFAPTRGLFRPESVARFARIRKKATVGFLVVLFILIFPALSWLQTTNFSGRWKLNAGKSDAGGSGAFLREMTLDIQHEGINLTIKKTIALRDRNWITEAKYTTDKKECLSDGESLKGLKSVCYFENDKFIIKGEEEAFQTIYNEDAPPYNEYFRVNFEREYSLSPDKTTLTIKQIAETILGKIKGTLVYDKIAS